MKANDSSALRLFGVPGLVPSLTVGLATVLFVSSLLVGVLLYRNGHGTEITTGLFLLGPLVLGGAAYYATRRPRRRARTAFQ